MTRIPDRGIAVIAADGCFMSALYQLEQESGLWDPVIVSGGNGCLPHCVPTSRTAGTT